MKTPLYLTMKVEFHWSEHKLNTVLRFQDLLGAINKSKSALMLQLFGLHPEVKIA